MNDMKCSLCGVDFISPVQPFVKCPECMVRTAELEKVNDDLKKKFIEKEAEMTNQAKIADMEVMLRNNRLDKLTDFSMFLVNTINKMLAMTGQKAVSYDDAYQKYIDQVNANVNGKDKENDTE